MTDEEKVELLVKFGQWLDDSGAPISEFGCGRDMQPYYDPVETWRIKELAQQFIDSLISKEVTQK